MVGDQLGRFRVCEPIGEGATAAVYAGEHVVLGHRVAIKILHREHMVNPSIEARFLREARAIASIRHPGIVELFDIGQCPGGQSYIVMELLSGESLADRLRGGALPLPTAIAFGRQMASALAAAHARGIIHRDLKPENAVIVPDPDVATGERVKIIDFGIAKRMRSGTPGPAITKTGMIVGTPQYMSPEQCMGCDQVDARSDVYSLGVVMYRMATGELPFREASTGEMLANHLYAQSRAPSELRPGVSAAMDAIIARCMEKLPEARYQSMQELSDALAELENGFGFEVDDRDTDVRAWEPAQRDITGDFVVDPTEPELPLPDPTEPVLIESRDTETAVLVSIAEPPTEKRTMVRPPPVPPPPLRARSAPEPAAVERALMRLHPAPIGAAADDEDVRNLPVEDDWTMDAAPPVYRPANSRARGWVIGALVAGTLLAAAGAVGIASRGGGGAAVEEPPAVAEPRAVEPAADEVTERVIEARAEPKSAPKHMRFRVVDPKVAPEPKPEPQPEPKMEPEPEPKIEIEEPAKSAAARSAPRRRSPKRERKPEPQREPEPVRAKENPFEGVDTPAVY